MLKRLASVYPDKLQANAKTYHYKRFLWPRITCRPRPIPGTLTRSLNPEWDSFSDGFRKVSWLIGLESRTDASVHDGNVLNLLGRITCPLSDVGNCHHPQQVTHAWTVSIQSSRPSFRINQSWTNVPRPGPILDSDWFPVITQENSTNANTNWGGGASHVNLT